MPDHTTIELEVCIASLSDAVLAAGHGAARVEVNSALELGGLTPSIGLVERVVEALGPTGCKLIAMVRPRPGGFDYSDEELAVMRRDIQRLLAAGVDGVAFGVLRGDSTVAPGANKQLIEPVLAAGREAVFHRAFDLTPSPTDALEALLALGFTRVLTSGGQRSAIEGAAVIRSLLERAAGRIQVLPGGGVRPENVADLVRATGCTQVHASLRQTLADRSVPGTSAVRLNSMPPSDAAYSATDREALLEMMRALRG